jgi:hypothetical protein
MPKLSTRMLAMTAIGLTVASVRLSAQSVGVTGVVMDYRTGVPLPDVRVIVDAQQPGVLTDASGAFAMAVPAGTHVIEATLVGYAIGRQTVTIGSDPISVTLRLAEGAGAFEERVTVRAPLPSSETPGGATLFGRDLQNLHGTLLDDPLRAVQSLPAAASTDDFYAQFSVRGGSFSRLGLTLDGIPSKYLLHTIEEATDAGSIAMVNSETLGSATLLPGSYPQRTGRHLGAQFDLAMREGDRERRAFRAGLSGTSATVLGEGPVASGRGGWLVSARQSYLDLLITRIDPAATFVFRFADTQGKFVYDVSSRHRIELLGVVGRTVFHDDESTLTPNEDARARKTGWLGGVSWRWLAGSSLTMMQRVYTTGATFTNINAADTPLDRGTSSDLGWRADGSVAVHPQSVLEFGGDVVRFNGEATKWRTLDGAQAPTTVRAINRGAVAAGAYAQMRVTPVSFITVTPGLRFDRWSLTGEQATSPWLGGEVRVARATRVVAATGLYTQFPAISQLSATALDGDLRRERARHADVSIVQSLLGDLSISVSGYQRRESDILWQPDGEARRVPDGTVMLGRGDAPWINALRGESHGIEVLVRRDSATGVSGWAGYAFGRTRYTDPSTGQSFWADEDQRHSFSAYSVYRLSSRASVSAKFRYGSNYPLRGYIEQTTSVGPGLFGGGGLRFYTLGTSRNTLRLPGYARLDARADRTFSLAGTRLTAFVEVVNVLNRTNVRNVPFSVDRSGRIVDATDTLMPLIPSAGFAIEF